MAVRNLLNNHLSATSLAGGGAKSDRVENDFYATCPDAVIRLLDNYKIHGKTMLEPCVGNGNIANVMKDRFNDIEITAVDIVDRGYPNTIVADFLKWHTDKKFDIIITNPPYSAVQEFAEHCLSMLSENGIIAMFLRIQFLEGEKRKAFFRKHPPKYVYVFSNRMPIWREGNPIDPSTGKKWATTLCHAWFVWENGFSGEPIIRWL